MTFGGVKDYAIVHLNFDKHIYNIFKYKKDRRYTARQQWNFIRNEKPVITGQLHSNSTIEDYWKLIETIS